MRRAAALALILLSFGQIAACGSDDSSGGPPHGAGGGSNADAEPDEELQPEIGTCKPMCCTSAECGTGKTCTAFETGSGTLGICSSGKDSATATAPPAGATLPVTCWSLNQSECNALTNEGCAADEVCDFAPGVEGVEAVVSCFGGGNTQADGETCDNAQGPWCLPGLHCVPTT
jgi:hypothetical protein